MFCNFSVFTAIDLAKHRHVFFSALGPETERQIKLAKNKFALTCSFQKVIRTLAFRGCEKQFILFQNSWHSLIAFFFFLASSKSFNLI